MAYATTADLITSFGEDAVTLRLGLDAEDNLITTDADSALTAVSVEIDMYLGVRYSLPLTTVPETLTQITCDIAWYKLAHDQSVGLSDEKRKRYEDAISLLRRIADGKATLPIPATDDDGDGEIDGPRAAFFEGPTRQFTRDSTKDL